MSLAHWLVGAASTVRSYVALREYMSVFLYFEFRSQVCVVMLVRGNVVGLLRW